MTSESINLKPGKNDPAAPAVLKSVVLYTGPFLLIIISELYRIKSGVFLYPLALPFGAAFLCSSFGGMRIAICNVILVGSYLYYMVVIGIGPPNLTGSFPRATLGFVVLAVISIVVGHNRDRIIKLLAHIRDRESTILKANNELEDRVAARTEELNRVSDKMVEALEKERRYIAGELHDQMGQTITALNLGLHAMQKKTDNPVMLNKIRHCVALTHAAIDHVRDMALDLRPPMLDSLGLEETLRWYIDKQKNNGLPIELTIEPLGERPNQLTETSCFRIAQEALTNAARYANASHIQVHLFETDNCLKLVVEDNGIGFDVSRVEALAAEGKSFGVTGISERARLAGGHLTLKSTPGTGTVIIANFPNWHRYQPDATETVDAAADT